MATEPTQMDLLPDELPEGEYATLPIDQLKLGFGPEPEHGLIESIRRLGILQPVIVETRAPHPEDAEWGWRVIDGRRRVLAAEMVAQEAVPCYVLPYGAVNPHVIQLASHALRSRNRAAEIDAIEALMRDGAGERDIAVATGLTVQEVRALLPLTTLSRTVRQALREGKVKASVAQEMVKLPASAQRRLEAKLTGEGKLTGGDVKEQKLVRTQQAAAALDLGALAGSVPDHTMDEEGARPAPAPIPDGGAVVREAPGMPTTGDWLGALRALAATELPERDWYPTEGDEVRTVTVVQWDTLLNAATGFKSVRDMRAWLKGCTGLVIIP